VIDFGKRLRDLRLLKEMSQEDLARQVGLSRSTISHWEVYRVPTPSQLRKLAEVLDVPVEDLTGHPITNKGKSRNLPELPLGRLPTAFMQQLDRMGYELKIVPKSNNLEATK
jgi:transcriptional regulator with XRE-family HTH domain